MKITRDITFFIIGAIAIALLQPQIVMSNQESLAAHQEKLIMLAKLIDIDTYGNIRLKTNGSILLQSGQNTTIQSGQNTTIKSSLPMTISSGTGIEINTHGPLSLHGAMTKIGKTNHAFAVNLKSRILCPSNLTPCTIIPSTSTVLIGN